ncbi:glycosyl hydrolase [Fusarium oxysporum]|uniref:Beta-xylosidase C-terminal Concanavalin A-like domain-containing protein n=1 Tax=Fusarium oxysporum TaxID=5507 RepID=A0A420ML51_FUSOX|nr:glycosyl hydrolase [Fusarium oxysporum]RKK68703.1 hypothetical protein BFJ69_g13391 [Fusarium oxysporum]
MSGPRPNACMNPIIPGWNPDPSCICVPELGNTFFCVVSSFSIFPGLPLYGSKDLIHWKLVCNIINRREQVPEIGTDRAQDNGIFAPTIRYHDGRFFVIVEYVTIEDPPTGFGLVFSALGPFDPLSWGNPVIFREPKGILDPDLFWDDDGQVYIQAGSFDQVIVQFNLDLETGISGPVKNIWHGTGGIAPEGPHLYKKDGYYYLLIAEGGTDLPHCVNIARATQPDGPFVPYEANPILTNRNTAEYFQTVGHADLFQDPEGNWWGVALSTRSGPEYRHYPMGRETILFSVVWAENDWPRLTSVKGRLSAPAFLPQRLDMPGTGHWNHEDELLEFPPKSPLPLHLVHWRFPPVNYISTSSTGQTHGLQLRPSRSTLTGSYGNISTNGVTLVARRQTSTLFVFEIDVKVPSNFPKGVEAGATTFVNEWQNVAMSLTSLQGAGSNSVVPRDGLYIKFQVNGKGAEPPQEHLDFIALPVEWANIQHIRFRIQATDYASYWFSACPSNNENLDRSVPTVIRMVDNAILSGGTGHWSGCLLGAFATSNGMESEIVFAVEKWQYKNNGQVIE